MMFTPLSALLAMTSATLVAADAVTPEANTFEVQAQEASSTASWHNMNNPPAYGAAEASTVYITTTCSMTITVTASDCLTTEAGISTELEPTTTTTIWEAFVSPPMSTGNGSTIVVPTSNSTIAIPPPVVTVSEGSAVSALSGVSAVVAALAGSLPFLNSF